MVDNITVREADVVSINDIPFKITQVRMNKIIAKPILVYTYSNNVMQFDKEKVDNANMRIATFVSTWQRFARDIQDTLEGELLQEEPSEFAVELARILGLTCMEKPIRILVEEPDEEDEDENLRDGTTGVDDGGAQLVSEEAS